MTDSLYLPDVDDAIIFALELRALRGGRSPEEEHRAILRQALSAETLTDFQAEAAALRARTRGRTHTPSEILQREGRDER